MILFINDSNLVYAWVCVCEFVYQKYRERWLFPGTQIYMIHGKGEKIDFGHPRIRMQIFIFLHVWIVNTNKNGCNHGLLPISPVQITWMFGYLVGNNYFSLSQRIQLYNHNKLL